MTLSDIKRRLKRIEEESGDSEMAHNLEDILFEDVLRAIAGGVENPSDLADAALQYGYIVVQQLQYSIGQTRAHRKLPAHIGYWLVQEYLYRYHKCFHAQHAGDIPYV